MEKIYTLADSFEASMHYHSQKGRQGFHNIPLKRKFYVKMFDDSIDFIRGHFKDYDKELEEFHELNGYSGKRQTVKFWNIVPESHWRQYCTSRDILEKENLIISIPFHIIEINSVTYD